MTGVPKFPLPKAYFDNQGPPLTADQQEAYLTTAQERIVAVLQAEREHVRLSQRRVSPAHWKLLKKRKQMRIFKRRPQASDSAQQPTMLGVGRMDGSLEDLIYGTYDKSYEEMKTTMAYVDIFTKDCNVLHNLELATVDDPFHYVGLKWTLSQLPGKLFVKPRDWCYIEAMGITHDADGQRYGYTIVHSVNVATCPPFDPRVVVRGRGSLSFIYREAADAPGVVEIFAQGLFDPAGELIQYFSVIMTTEIFSGQALTVRCAEAKKLTLLALHNYRGVGGTGGRHHESIEKTCFLCVRSDSLFSSLKLCNICGATTCDKCRVKRHTFMGANHAVCEVTCCQSCILEAKSMAVRPAEAIFSIHSSNDVPHALAQSSSTTSGQVRKTSTKQSLQLSSSSSSASELETLDDDQFSSYRSMDETDFEKMIEAMIDQRHQEFGTSRANSQQIEYVSSTGDADGDDMVVAAEPELPEAQQQQRQPPLAAVDEDTVIFQKLLALQSAATKVAKITQANEEYMKYL